MSNFAELSPSPDTPLSEVRQLMLEHPAMDDTLGLVRLGRQVRVRFVWASNGKEFPDETQWGVFHKLNCIGAATIVIDDLGGGLRMGSPELVT